MIYFIQDTLTCHIKIGFTDGDPDARLRALQTGNPNPLVLLGTSQGDLEDEQDLHRRFSEWRVQGEWFKPAKAVIEAAHGEAMSLSYQEKRRFLRSLLADADFAEAIVKLLPVRGRSEG